MTLDRLTTVQLLVLAERLSNHAHGAWRRMHADCRNRPKQQEPDRELAARYALRMRLFRRANDLLYRRYTGHDID
jgi:hypothetical protein